ncbi:MAG: lipopolysaccharide biosynthesis protein [Egibacteraceae bacterium]
MSLSGGSDISASGGSDISASGGSDISASGGSDMSLSGGSDISASGGSDISAGAPASTRPALVNATVVMVGGTAVGAFGAYGFQLVGGRALGPVDFAPLSVLWTLQVLVLMVALVPVEQLVTRRLELTGGQTAKLGAVAQPLLGVLAASTVGVTGLAWLLRDRLLDGDPAYVAVAGLLVVGYTVFAVGRGYLAGRRRYRAYGLATAGEGLLRLALTGPALLAAEDGRLLAWAMVAAPFAVLLLRPFSAARVGVQSASDGLGSVREFLGPLIFANTLSQAVIGSAPLVVGALGATPVVVSVVFLTFALFRGPLWIVQSALARVLPPLTALAAGGDYQTLRAWATRLAAGGVAAAAVAWAGGLWLGPAVVGLMFGAEFAPPPALAALVACGTALAAAVLCSTQILVALGQTSRVAAAWTLAAAVTVTVTLLTPSNPSVQVGNGFVAGELTALLLMTKAGWRNGSEPGRLGGFRWSSSGSQR